MRPLGVPSLSTRVAQFGAEGDNRSIEARQGGTIAHVTLVYAIRENRIVLLDLTAQTLSSQVILRLRPTVFDSRDLDRYAGVSRWELT